jgi:hypothetical protein
LGESLGYKANLFHYDAQPGKIGTRDFKNTLDTYQMRFYERDTNQDKKRKAARPVHLVHGGITYRLSYVQSVTPTPYKGEVWNLTVEDCPTFQTAVGMSHNTIKPRVLMARLMADVPRDQGAMLDPFMGSGSTGIACVQTGHDFVGVEREEEYYQIATTRIAHWEEARRQGVEGMGKEKATIISEFTPPEPPRPETDETYSDMDDLFGF